MTLAQALALLRDLYPNASREIDACRLNTTPASLTAVVYGHRRPSDELAAAISADTGGVLSMEVLRRWDFAIPRNARAFERDPVPSKHTMAPATATTGTNA